MPVQRIKLIRESIRNSQNLRRLEKRGVQGAVDILVGMKDLTGEV